MEQSNSSSLHSIDAQLRVEILRILGDSTACAVWQPRQCQQGLPGPPQYVRFGSDTSRGRAEPCKWHHLSSSNRPRASDKTSVRLLFLSPRRASHTVSARRLCPQEARLWLSRWYHKASQIKIVAQRTVLDEKWPVNHHCVRVYGSIKVSREGSVVVDAELIHKFPHILPAVVVAK